jgi:hypothetical protein
MERPKTRIRRALRPRAEGLETRALLSVFLADNPTLEVVTRGRDVTRFRDGYAIVQPTGLRVRGEAQPDGVGYTTQVEIYARDRRGAVLNGGAPLAVTKVDSFGRYSAKLTLPSTVRKDMNMLVARQVAVGTLTGTTLIAPTTLTGLTGNLAIAPTSIQGLAGSINLPSTQITGLQATLVNEPMVGVIAGGLSLTGTSRDLVGTAGGLPLIQIGSAIVELDGGLVGVELALPVSDSQITDGSGTIAAQDGTLSGGTGTIAATTGTLTQTGAATIAATTGVSTFRVREFSLSNTVKVFIHQRNRSGHDHSGHDHADHAHAQATPARRRAIRPSGRSAGR